MPIFLEALCERGHRFTGTMKAPEPCPECQAQDKQNEAVAKAVLKDLLPVLDEIDSRLKKLETK